MPGNGGRSTGDSGDMLSLMQLHAVKGGRRRRGIDEVLRVMTMWMVDWRKGCWELRGGDEVW